MSGLALLQRNKNFAVKVWDMLAVSWESLSASGSIANMYDVAGVVLVPSNGVGLVNLDFSFLTLVKDHS